MLLLLLLSLLIGQGAARADYPSAAQLAQGIRRALEADARNLSELTYLERRRDVKLSKLGKVTIGPMRTFEVHSGLPGGAYKRLIEEEGKPLTPAELARRDAEHEHDLAREAERQRSETPSQRAERLQKGEEEHKHRSDMLDDGMAVFEPTFVGREVIEGEPVFVVDLKPRPGARTKTREGRWMKQFAGRIWVDQSDYQVVRLDMRAFDDVTIGWGIIGRLHKGSRVLFSRRKVNELWLPAELTYEASGRTLLFRWFEFTVTTTYSDYKRRVPASQ